jgi:chromosomal replication initiator protein
MPESSTDTWKRILAAARAELEPQKFRAFLEKSVVLEHADGVLAVGVADRFAVEYNERHHADLLARHARQFLGSDARLEFRVDPTQRAELPQMDFFVAPAAPSANGAAPAPARNPSSQPLNERYTFDQFVIGKSNELAAAAAYAVGEAPGRTYNPLFIYGATGLGKTHLMQAIAHAVVSRNPETKVLYIGAEQFLNELIESINNRTMSEFRRRYREEVDLFLVDDVHFIAGKEQTQEEFFHTFNALHQHGKQIVLTSDRPPKELTGLEARLVSRFESGLVADVGQPDLEHRIAILRKKAEQDHLDAQIPDEVIRFIAEHVRSNVRELEGCIIKLLLYGSLRKREVSVELAREALADKIRASANAEPDAPRERPSIGRLQEVVARRWGVTPEGLKSKARIQTLTVPRQIAMYLARNCLEMNLIEIGQAFGGRDHSTVIHSVDKVERQLRQDRAFRDRVESAKQELFAN